MNARCSWTLNTERGTARLSSVTSQTGINSKVLDYIILANMHLAWSLLRCSDVSL